MAQEIIDHRKYPTRYPVVKTYSGELRKTAEEDLMDIELWISQGHSLDWCAVELGLCQRDFKAACKVNLRLQDSIQRGRSLNLDEYMVGLKAAAHEFKNSDLVKWYGKQAFKMADRQEQNITGGGVVIVNTGINTGIPASKPSNVIEHDNV